ncbi:MAG: undecaprenyldiphospho-muramoylpentapeptide beta-N-acetylglucosaminyltransferase [bacterium]
MSRTEPRILIAAGGTGGHLFPALAIADELKRMRPSAEILFVGTKEKIETRIVPQRGYAFQTIWISGLHRRLTIENLLFPLKVCVSLLQSFFLIRRFQPHAVIGTGGYVCGPVLYVASLINIPVFIHESNSFPGVTTRMLAGRAERVYIAFEVSKRWLKRTDHVELVGTPTRESLGTIPAAEGRKFFQLDPARKTVLVMGGSLGAASINTAVLDMLDTVIAADIQLIWQTGKADFERIKSVVGEKRFAWLGPFIDTMEYALGAADVVVCRAGATTIAELTRTGKPAILIPYPHAAADHQTHNAQSLVDAGAALMIADTEVRSKLGTAVLQLVNDQNRLSDMSTAATRFGRPKAATTIAEQILKAIQE